MRRIKLVSTICMSLYLIINVYSIACANIIHNGKATDSISFYKDIYSTLIHDCFNNDYKDNKLITRIEFAELINKAYGFNKKTVIAFKDTPTNSIVEDEAAKAVRAGYMLGYGNKTFRPYENINKQEIATVVFRLMKLDKTSNSSIKSISKDLNKSPKWSQDIISAVIKSGYMNADGNSFNPTKAITRKEAIKLLDGLMGTLFTKSGNYGQGADVQEIEGNVTICTSGVKICNKILKGDLYITPGANEGSIELENIRVTGRTIMCGGANITIAKKSQIGTVIIEKNAGGTLKVTATSNSKTGNVSIRSGVYLREEGVTGLAFGEITIDKGVKPRDIVVLEGDFTTITGNAPDIVINIKKGSMAGTINLNAKTNITGDGMIGTVNINAGGCTIEQTPGRVNIYTDLYPS